LTDTPEEQLKVLARRLADAIDAALPIWVRAKVREVLDAEGIPTTPEIEAAIEAAAALARSEVGQSVRRLLEADVDAQRTTPLALLRTAVVYPTAVLHACGAAGRRRDRFAAEAFPADLYDLSPASFSDLDPSDGELADAGLTWGAAKAFVHRHRHSGI
jgi:hypothetical protein